MCMGVLPIECARGCVAFQAVANAGLARSRMRRSTTERGNQSLGRSAATRPVWNAVRSAN